MIELVDGSQPEHIETVRSLFLEYAQWLGFSLCFQGFDEELATLPGRYAPPQGRILLALDDGRPAGVVALRPLVLKAADSCSGSHGAADPSPGSPSLTDLSLEGRGGAKMGESEGSHTGCEVGVTGHGAHVASDNVSEMKRLWVRPEYRGTGLGRRLAAEIVAAGREIGYSEMVLDTLERMEAARGIYASFGFERTDAYYDNPQDEVVFMRLQLEP